MLFLWDHVTRLLICRSAWCLNLTFFIKWTTCCCLSTWEIVSSLLLSSIDRTSYLGEFVDGDTVKTDGRGEGGISISQDIAGCGIDLAVVFQRARVCVRVCMCVRVWMRCPALPLSWNVCVRMRVCVVVHDCACVCVYACACAGVRACSVRVRLRVLRTDQLE